MNCEKILSELAEVKRPRKILEKYSPNASKLMLKKLIHRGNVRLDRRWAGYLTTKKRLKNLEDECLDFAELEDVAVADELLEDVAVADDQLAELLEDVEISDFADGDHGGELVVGAKESESQSPAPANLKVLKTTKSSPAA